MDMREHETLAWFVSEPEPGNAAILFGRFSREIDRVDGFHDKAATLNTAK